MAFLRTANMTKRNLQGKQKTKSLIMPLPRTAPASCFFLCRAEAAHTDHNVQDQDVQPRRALPSSCGFEKNKKQS